MTTAWRLQRESERQTAAGRASSWRWLNFLCPRWVAPSFAWPRAFSCSHPSPPPNPPSLSPLLALLFSKWPRSVPPLHASSPFKPSSQPAGGDKQQRVQLVDALPSSYIISRPLSRRSTTLTYSPSPPSSLHRCLSPLSLPSSLVSDRSDTIRR